MSDGPHRSLPMRAWWKRAAQRADIAAFSPDEVAAVVGPALERDCRHELSPAFLEGLRNASREPALPGLPASPHLENLRAQARPGLEHHVLANISALSGSDAADLDVVVTGFERAIQSHAQRHFRSIEEHYDRASTMDRSARVRDSFQDALPLVRTRDIAERLLRPGGSRTVPIAPLKSGLDDGVRLR